MTAELPPIELHYWPTPNGRKVAIILEECELAYAVVMVDITVGEQFLPRFLEISPNNRIPAIVDPQGPDGAPISVFESGAILKYLAGKTGRFGGETAREKVAIDEWLFWQVGGLGPMAGQASHFRLYAPEQIPYAIKRYTDEVHRLFGVMDARLAAREYLAGCYSIADMASIGWVRIWKRLGQDLADFPHLKRWCDVLHARPAVARAIPPAAASTSPRTRRRGRPCSGNGRGESPERGRHAASLAVDELIEDGRAFVGKATAVNSARNRRPRAVRRPGST